MDEAASCSRQRGPGLLSLPSSVLEAIFALVDLRQRAGVLPLVCAAVRRQLAGPSASLWHDLRFECDIAHASQRTRATSFLAWLRRHGQHSRALQLDMWNGGQPPPAEQEGVHRALREVLEATLAASLPSCEFLRLRWGGRVLVVGDWAAAATSLTCLALSGHEVCVGSPLGALSSLVHLELSTTEDIGPSLEPGCLPASLTRLCCVPAPASAPPPLGDDDWPGLAEAQIPEEALALPHLVYLDVSESLFARAHLEAALPRLTRLTSLAFDKCELAGGIPAQLSLLTRLRVLSFDGCPAQEVEDALQPSWTVLSALTRIASLSISNSRLESVPPALAAMPSLQHLYLEHNAIRALPPGPYLRRLVVLSTDWEPLLRSHALLAQAPRLRKLALGSQSVLAHDGEGLPPLAEVPQLLRSLQRHPALEQVLLVARPGHVHGAICVVLEAILQLRSVRPSLAVRPILHDAFFVEEPPPEEEEEEEEEGQQEEDREGGNSQREQQR